MIYLCGFFSINFLFYLESMVVEDFEFLEKHGIREQPWYILNKLNRKLAYYKKPSFDNDDFKQLLAIIETRIGFVLNS